MQPRVTTAALLVLPIWLSPGIACAEDLLTQARFQGGLVVEVNPPRADRIAVSAPNDTAVIQALLPREVGMDAARSKGGRITTAAWDGKVLPYADNMVNLLIVHNKDDVPSGEIDRVLAPLATAMIRANGAWTRHTKPWPEAMDEWSHHHHGPDNIPVARDTVVGPPSHMQWVAGPMYARSHEINSSLAAMVTARGRLFYFWDEGTTGLVDKRMPDAWTLIARDAFNGVLLWKKPIAKFGWRKWHDKRMWASGKTWALMLRVAPTTLARRLVADQDRVYATLGYEAPVSVLDAATGAVLSVVPGTEKTDEIICHETTLVLRVRTADSPPEKNAWTEMAPQSATIMAVNARTGEQLWQTDPGPVAPHTLAATPGKVVYANYKQVVCLDRATGKTLWRTEPGKMAETYKRARSGALAVLDKVVLYSKGAITAYDTETGRILWKSPKSVRSSLFVARGLLWAREETKGTKDDVRNATEVRSIGLDPLTGETVREVSAPKLKSPGHHARCYPGKATERFLMLNKRGIEYLDLTDDRHMRTDWLRAPCIYGSLPANGLTYMAPHQCVCYPGVLLANFNVMTAHNRQPTTAKAERLFKGPAYGKAGSAGVDDGSDWPTYRRDHTRSARASTEVPDRPHEKWRTRLAAPLTPPVVASGRVYVAEKDAHRVVALDAATGKRAWHYTAGARIDSPPTLHGGRVFFGSTDGHVYALTASDGALQWRFRAAPALRQIMVYGQLESAWPVHGSVLIQQDRITGKHLVYLTAGRSTYLDGGIHAYALDSNTGAVVYRNRLDGPHADPQKDAGTAGYMDGTKTDILASDGSDIYLFQERLSSDLKRFPAPMKDLGPQGGGHRLYPAATDRNASGRRLIATGGFLDTTFNEGHYWIYDTRWPGWDRGRSRLTAACGRLLSFDDQWVYGAEMMLKHVRVRPGFTPGEQGSLIFAAKHKPKMVKKGKRNVAAYEWERHIPVRVRSMVLTRDKLILAGPADVVPAEDPAASFRPDADAVLTTLSRTTGTVINTQKLVEAPVFDGLIAADGALFLSGRNGTVVCLAGTARKGGVPKGQTVP